MEKQREITFEQAETMVSEMRKAGATRREILKKLEPLDDGNHSLLTHFVGGEWASELATPAPRLHGRVLIDANLVDRAARWLLSSGNGGLESLGVQLREDLYKELELRAQAEKRQAHAALGIAGKGTRLVKS